MSDTKMTAEESCRQVLKTIADSCDQETLARVGGYLFRYIQEETVLRDCGQREVCRTPPGCMRHWEERNRELVRENEVLRSTSDHLGSDNVLALIEHYQEDAISEMVRRQKTEAALGHVVEVLEALAASECSGHSGDSETGEHDADCMRCRVDAALAHADSVGEQP